MSTEFLNVINFALIPLVLILLSHTLDRTFVTFSLTVCCEFIKSEHETMNPEDEVIHESEEGSHMSVRVRLRREWRNVCVCLIGKK